MPILESKFIPRNASFKNPHFSTIHASLLRRIKRVNYTRERFELPDGDFLDLDWYPNGSTDLIITLPGLEGKSNSLYSRAAVNYFTARGWDAMGLNYRGCSGEPNRLLRGYHMGVSDDLDLAIKHIVREKNYKRIVLLGYSLGGNIALKYLGEKGGALPEEVKASISFSVPMKIKQSNNRLNEWYNWHYLKWFMFPLNRKANRKKRQFPSALKNYRGFFMSGNFVYFDQHFTAPANGFDSVDAYWGSASCSPVLNRISVPSLVVNSSDDTFISPGCYPYQEAKENDLLYLEIAEHGGHCGFIRNWAEKTWWMEERAYEFLEEQNII